MPTIARRETGAGVSCRSGRRLAGVARLLLHHVEDGGEEGAHALLAERACVRADELVEELSLAGGVDERRARLLLVRADAPHELEPAVERSQHFAVHGRDVLAQVVQIRVVQDAQSTRSASSAFCTCSRFSACCHTADWPP